MTIQDIKTTAQLAMLDISDPERLERAFGEMLDYFSMMMQVNVDGLEPTTHALARENRLRPDVVSSPPADESLLNAAPERDERFFLIPNVL